MAMELKTTDDPRFVEIHDEQGWIGHILYVEPEEEGDTVQGWSAELRGFHYGLTRSTDFYDTAPEAFAAAAPLYKELLEVRRTAERFHRNTPVRTISTPMGGQPR
ncbi:hypothetical protein [Streptomyces sp. NPDC050485]|uniref:hypothetical protein n=1 Tax=Streptomyces sp. NPDC050485 TaxID=3365617 RepID=UPI0037AF6C82